MNRLFLFPILLLTVACFDKESDSGDIEDSAEDSGIVDTGDSPPLENIDLDLSHFSGCGDFFIYGKNADDTKALHIAGNGLAQAAHDAGETITVVHDLNVDSTSNPPAVKALLGQNLNYESCNDALDSSVVVEISTEFIAVTGELTLTASPSGEATDWGEVPAQVDVQLREVTLCADGSWDNCLHIDSLDFSADIGWMPG